MSKNTLKKFKEKLKNNRKKQGRMEVDAHVEGNEERYNTDNTKSLVKQRRFPKT